ncbi:FAD:protein FMN transferase [Fulvitalea axinellae]|uniref:FAD:protein FMN transferase n=1 Tax=Fulvitalea axinellae TaxID=1182444 RepID=A0AAU9CIP7_9BACT|nr:FAD:protein FMN transferase [Fulvitalea axinellae]
MLALNLSFLSAQATSEQSYSRAEQLMGCHFSITVTAENPTEAKRYLDLAILEVKRIESLISSWDEKSQTSEINRNAGVKPVKVDKELFKLIERSVSLSKLTDGDFDISFASAEELRKAEESIPESSDMGKIRKSARAIGFRNIILDKNAGTVFLKTKGMKIDFGAVGKGYALDKIRSLLIAKGVSAGRVDASGDICVWGKQLGGENWKVTVNDPFDQRKTLAVLPIPNGAVATSKKYHVSIKTDGQHHSHIIDPETGLSPKGLASVTVFAPVAEFADALATSIFVMGRKAGLKLINQTPGTECLIVDESGAVFTSKNIKINQP